MGSFVLPQQMPLSLKQTRGVLAEGYQRHFGYAANEDELSVAWAQVCLETGKPPKPWNFNLGNLKYTAASWSGDWTLIPVAPPEPAAQRSYATPEDGAQDYWALLDTPRFSSALQWFAVGDVANAAVRLGEAGWYGPPPGSSQAQKNAAIAAYAATMVRLQAEYRRLFVQSTTFRKSYAIGVAVAAALVLGVAVYVTRQK
jgi:hypothetical protein